MEIDINEVEEININKMDKRQMANRLNALVKLAKGDIFTTHDLDEAITLTKKLNGQEGKMQILINVIFAIYVIVSVANIVSGMKRDSRQYK